MTHAPLPLAPRRGFGETSRKDKWWIQPIAVFIGLSIFVIYATWAAFQGEHYRFGPYLSPLYSPELFGDPEHAAFGGQPSWWPAFLPFSPALLILGGPVGFRLTCYYYRGAYYKAFWADPPNCSVGEPRKSYLGEQRFPLLIQNVHRWFLYVAILFIVILTYDALIAFRFADPATGASSFGIGVGSLVLTANVIALGCYTFGCHSFRHLIGGRRDSISSSTGGRIAYDCTSCLNRGHMRWAWTSLVIVGLADLYVRLCSMGVITDFRVVF
jgi:hypothetical protein